MILKKRAAAGTLESSDTIVTAEPGDDQLDIYIESIVLDQFGEEIKKTVIEVCNEFKVSSGKISVKDRGALECTIKARVETALFRAGETE